MYGEKKGTIRCYLVDGKAKEMGYGYAVLSGLSLLTLNFFGLPFGGEKVNMQIAVDVYDKNNNLVATYKSQPHKNKAYMACYWGYGMSSVERYPILKTFSECLNDIHREMQYDSERVSKILKGEEK